MRKLFLTITLSLLAAVAAVAQVQKRDYLFVTDTPMVHDPVVAFDGKQYFMFSTGHGLQLATSTDMKSWTIMQKPVIKTVPAWAKDSVPGLGDHIWAPDIIRYGNRWWLTYSCSTFGKRTSAIALASTDSLAVGAVWRDHGPLICSKEGRDNFNAIDPNIVIGEDGMPWLTFGSFWGGIQLMPLDSTMRPRKDCRPVTVANRRVEKGRANPIEAPFIMRHGDYFYLFVSWDYCCKGLESTYKVAVGRSKSVAGPYLDRDGKAMTDGGGTVVLEGDKKEFVAAGHSAAYHFAGQDVFLCHAYSIPRQGASVLLKRTVKWTPDGWPTL